MIKKIYLLMFVAVFGVIFSSCKQDKWETAPTVMVDTYKVSGFKSALAGAENNNVPEYVSVYRTKPSVVMMYKAQSAKIATMTSFIDSSNDIEYAFAYTVKSGDSEIHYNYSGSRVTGVVTLEVTDGETVTKYSNLAVLETPEVSTDENSGISEVQDKTFRAIANAIFVDSEAADCILLHANSYYGTIDVADVSGFTVMVNNEVANVQSVAVNANNGSVLNIKLESPVQATDVVTIVYNGNGKVKSTEGRAMLAFDKTNVKFI